MYIEKLKICNFRIIDKNGVELKFNKGINAIIGANNIGKTAIIDAIRIATSICDYKKNIYFSMSDFHINKNGTRETTAQIDVFLSDVPENLIEIWDPENPTKGEYHIRFRIEKNKQGEDKIKYETWGGKYEGNNLSGEFFDTIKLSYLNALRNVENDLYPSRNSKIGNLVSSLFVDESEKNSLLSEIFNANKEILSNEKITKAKKIINTNLSEIEKINSQRIELNFIDPKFENVTSSLKTLFIPKWTFVDNEEIKKFITDNNLNDYKLENNDGFFVDVERLLEENEIDSLIKNKLLELQHFSLEIYQNGLGYNNILYIATVLGDMSQTNDEVYSKIFLIEEPEAHLHPQLQQLLQSFFDKQCKSITNVQIIYTSHSPSLVSKADLDNLNILCEVENKIKCISLQDTNIVQKDNSETTNNNDKDYLLRYMDVTKSQLFFAKGVIFVEGISESLIINEIAKKMNKSLEDYCVELINIDGVAFEPFIKLLTLKENNSLYIKSVIITDDDRCTNKQDINTYISKEIDYDYTNIAEISQKISSGTQSDRCDKIDETISGLKGICVSKAKKTLEYELAISNQKIMLNILKEIHKTSGKNLEEIVNSLQSEDEKATTIWLFINSRPQDKAVIAQKLIEKISSSEFKIPKYIEDAILYVTGDEL